MSVTLIASDGVELKVDFEIIKQSKIVAGMLENLQQDNPTDLSDEQIPITNVTSAILKRIIEWCTLVFRNPRTGRSGLKHSFHLLVYNQIF